MYFVNDIPFTQSHLANIHKKFGKLFLNHPVYFNFLKIALTYGLTYGVVCLR